MPRIARGEKKEARITSEVDLFSKTWTLGLLASLALGFGCDRLNGQSPPPQNGYDQNNPNGPNGYPNNGYPPNGYPNNGAPNPNGYPNNGYPNNGYPNNGYPNNGAPNNAPPNGYPNNGVPNNAPYGAPQNPSAPPNAPMNPPAYPAPSATYTAPPPSAAPSSTSPNGFPVPQFPWALPSSNPNNPAPSNGAGSATPIDPTLATVATVPLFAYAQQQAPGMQKDGSILAGNYKEGQTLEQAVQILPGKCYTLLAVGAGPSQIDLALIATTPIPNVSPVLAQTSGSGNQAALGGGSNCYKWPLQFGVNGKYVVKSAKGQGIIAAQLYSK